MRSSQPVRKSVQASLEHLAVVVVAEGVGRSTASAKMFTRLVSLAELAVALAEVEVQRGIEASHRASHSAARCALVGEQISRGQRSQIPEQFLVHVVLRVRHRMSECTAVERIPALATDLTPHLGEQIARRDALTLFMQCDALADTDHHCLRFVTKLLVTIVRTVVVTTDRAAVATCR